MNKYTYHVFWSDEDEGYIATCSEFPRLSTFGDTREEATAEMDVSVELAIETYTREGWPIPEPKKPIRQSGQFRLRLPPSLHATLVELADEEGVSLNTLIVSYLSAATREQQITKAFAVSIESCVGDIVKGVVGGVVPEISRVKSYMERLQRSHTGTLVAMGRFVEASALVTMKGREYMLDTYAPRGEIRVLTRAAEDKTSAEQQVMPAALTYSFSSELGNLVESERRR